MPTQTINGLTYAYLRQGSGPPLILLHGFTGSAASWSDIQPALADHYDVIAIDLPGHGRTTGAASPDRMRMSAVAADIISLLESLSIGPAHLLGYSMGGRLALYLALLAPQHWRKLILESASPGLSEPEARRQRRESDEQLAARILKDDITAFVDYWQAIPLFASQRMLAPQVRARLRAGRLANDPAGLANSLRGMGTGRQPSLWEALPQMRTPTLLMAGERDPKFVTINRAMHDQMPGSTLLLFPEAGHTIHLELPQPFLTAVLDFLST